MISIELNRKEGEYNSEGVSVKVTEELYPPCKVFHRYIHEPEGMKWMGNKIALLKSKDSSKQQHVVFSQNRQYTHNSLKSAVVYFNRYDSKNENPLVLALIFEGSNVTQNKYCRLSKFDKRQSTFPPIDILDNYEGEVQLLQIIYNENQKINKQITFRIRTDIDQQSVKQYSEEIGGIFERVTFLADKNKDKTNLLRGTYELNSSKLFKGGQSTIDDEIVREYEFKPFNAVCVYYYKKEDIELLIEFVADFKLSHIRRIKSDGGSKWLKEDRKIEYMCNEDLTNYLKIILHCLKNKIIIRLDKQREYTDNKVIDSLTDDSKSTENPKKITPIKNCTSLPNKYEGYVCFKHDLREYYNTNLRNLVDNFKSYCTFKFDMRFEIVFLISNCEISICGSTGSGKEYLFYKPGPGPPGNKVYVYFYETGKNKGHPDTVPLMFKFNAKFYGTNERNSYFEKWKEINDMPILDISNENQHITSKLDEINKSLNQMYLSKTDNYGLTGLKCLPETAEFYLNPDRVLVQTSELGPPSTFGKPHSSTIHCDIKVYSKHVHSTVNKFQIGKIFYNDQEISVVDQNGGQPTNGKEIEVKPEQNQLTVYCLTEDKSCTYPLLIGIGKQKNNQPTEQGTVEVFYELFSNGTSYKWKKSGLQGGSDTFGIIRLLDQINYRFKKVVKIELGQRIPYELKFKPSTSGSQETIYKMHNHQVHVGICHVCSKLWKSGYRCFCQNISKIEGLDQSSIGGLELYIPKELPNKKHSVTPSDQEICLYKIKNDEDEIRGKVINGTPFKDIESSLEEYKPIYYTSCRPELYVYFYKDDPRPGLLCFGNYAYKPIQLPQLDNGKYDYEKDDYRKWVGIREIRRCVCDNKEDLKFLNELLTGMYFSSPLEKFMIENWVPITAGTGTGVIGAGGVAGGGYFLYSYIAGVQFLI